MLSKITISGAALAAAMLFATVPGSAQPAMPALSLLKGAAAEQSIVEKTHGWHRTCRKGFTDVHKHVRGVGRVTCKTRRCTTDGLGVKHCIWT